MAPTIHLGLGSQDLLHFLNSGLKTKIAWIAMAGLALGLDYVSGPRIHFPVLYLFPILLVAWTGGRGLGLTLALLMSLSRFGFEIHWEEQNDLTEEIINFLVCFLVFSVVAVLAATVGIRDRLLQTEVQALEGLLPICSYCKKIRNEEDKWEAIESYVSERSEAKFSHSLCPDCLNEYYPEEARLMGRSSDSNTKVGP